jgi:aerobic-type carbon monoxide dehydrogenase small subunit (CoxS/CutS family)
VELTVTVNGEAHRLQARPDEMLVTVLRRELGLLSVRETCGIGVCGSCTVLVDGEPFTACLVLAPLVDGREIVTAEGLADDVVQEAFASAHAFQCGWCTPGFVLTVSSLLRESASPSREEIARALAGNLCRCGSYLKVVEAVEQAALVAARTQPGGG